MATRPEILETARKCVCGDREQDYGSPENNFERIAKLWEAYVRGKCVSSDADVCFAPHDVAAMLILLKVARVASGNAKDDNWVDIAGYAACGGELESGGTATQAEDKPDDMPFVQDCNVCGKPAGPGRAICEDCAKQLNKDMNADV